MQKLVSIGIPTYNRPLELERCVRNLLNQTYKNIEILISDNNSNNKLCKVLYSSDLFKNPKIKIYFNKQNLGVLKNTHNIFLKAKGEYFCWISDDDWRSEIFIEEMVKQLEKLGEGYICFSKYIEVENDCRQSSSHLKIKDNLKLLKSNSKFIRKIYYYLLDSANGKCNLFYSLIPTKELRKINFIRASNNWKNLSMDSNIIQLLLNRNKVHITNYLLASLTVKNKKYYLTRANKKQKKSLFNKLKDLFLSINNETNLLFNEMEEGIRKYLIYFFYSIKILILITNRLFLKFKLFYLNKVSLKKNKPDAHAIKRIENHKIKDGNKLHLDEVSIVCVATTDVEKAAMALRYSMLDINFKKALLLSTYNPWNLGEKIDFIRINKFNNVDDWGKFIIYDLVEYIETKYILLIHPDGFVVNPNLWDDQFLNYDYIGSPWPKPKDNFSYRTSDGDIIRVGNSVSIRSKKILGLPKKLNLEWKSYYGNYNEDGFLCVHNRKTLQNNGIKFADKEIAYSFGIEIPLPEFNSYKSFTFHKWQKFNRHYPKFKNY